MITADVSDAFLQRVEAQDADGLAALFTDDIDCDVLWVPGAPASSSRRAEPRDDHVQSRGVDQRTRPITDT